MVTRPVLAPLLRVRGLSHRKGTVEVLRNVSLALGESSLTGLIGPNGAGKSTLIDLISGISRVQQGSILLGDEELAGRPVHEIADLGISRTFQQLRLFQGMTALENVLVGGHLRFGYSLADTLLRRTRMQRNEAAAMAEALRLLDLLGLRQQAGVRAHELPLGARRRLEIARALAADPLLLLLDEPAVGMNGRETADLLACLRTLRASGHAMLLTAHDIGFVMELCEQLLVLSAGTLVAQGDPDEVRGNLAVIEAYQGLGADPG